MNTVKDVISTFIKGDYFFLFILVIILLLTALIIYILEIKKFDDEDKKDDKVLNDIEELKKDLGKKDDSIVITKDIVKDDKSQNKEIEKLKKDLVNNDVIETKENNINNENKKEDFCIENLKKDLSFDNKKTLDDESNTEEIPLENILTNELFNEDEITKKENTILVEDTSYENIQTYEDEEEKSAIISTEELERKNQERLMTMGVTENQSLIEKYEEEQEQKAIISYEELLKNAKNVSVTYEDEIHGEYIDLNAPSIKRMEVNEVKYEIKRTYIDEELYLSKLKEFRIKLE